jgi:hypothetical protein
MHKKTPTIIGLAIATILTAYISALAMSNEAFAQSSQHQAFPSLNPAVHNNAAITSPTHVVPIYPYIVYLKGQIAYVKGVIEAMVAAPIIGHPR